MIHAIKNWYIKQRAYKQIYKELSALSNHQLADLGLHRGLIEQMALEAVYGKGANNYV